MMKRILILLFLLTAALVMAVRSVGQVSLGHNGRIAAWLPTPVGGIVVEANYDQPDLDFDAGRGNARIRSSQTVPELEQFYDEWLEREGFVAIDGLHRVIVVEPTRAAFAKLACHRHKGRFLNIVGAEESTSTGVYGGVTLVYWESQDTAFVQDLFGLKPGERPCDY